MRAKSSEKFNNQNFLEKIESSITEYPTSRLGPKLEKNKNSTNLNIFNENFVSNPKVPTSKNLNSQQNLSNKNQFSKTQNQIANNLSVLQRSKTGVIVLFLKINSIEKLSRSCFNWLAFYIFG